MTTFVQACNDKMVGNIAAMSSTRSQYSVITFLPGQRATVSHHTRWGDANTAFRGRDKDSNVHIYNNALRMCAKRSVCR